MAAAGKARSAAGDSSRPRRVAMVAFDGANVIDVTGPLEVFSQVGRQRYDWAGSAYQTILLAPRAGEITTSSGVRLVAAKAFHAERGPLDTLIVAGGDVRVAARDERLLAWLRRMRPRVRRLASVCTGAFVLAQAGLLAGRRATTHWGSAARLAERYPDVSVDGDAIYVRDGDVYTSAGVTAGMDLALALVEEDHGRDAALAVARQLVLFLKRPGGQAQFSSHLAAQTVERGVLGELTEWILDHLGDPLTVETLARRAAMSPRNFARVFRQRTGLTPAKFVERVRIDRARRRLEESDARVEAVAVECGFGNAERMRRTFRRHLRVVPQDYRRRFELVGEGARRPRGRG